MNWAAFLLAFAITGASKLLTTHNGFPSDWGIGFLAGGATMTILKWRA